MDWKKIDFSFIAELKGIVLVLVAVFVLIPMLSYGLFTEGKWAGALALIGLLALPAVTFALWAKGARERVVRIAVFITMAAIPVFIWLETRAFMK